MEAWVFTCSDSPLEHWLDGFEMRFDAWEEGGVTGIVVGRLAFRQDDGSTIPAYAPDPEVYKALGAEVSAPSPRDLEKEKKLQAMLDNAAARGWCILIFSGVGSTAHVQDQMNTFPQVHGVIADGPGEQCGDDRRVDSTREPTDDSLGTDPGADLFDLLFDQRADIPGALAPADVPYEVLQQLTTGVGVSHLGVKLQTVDGSIGMPDSGQRAGVGGCQ